MKKLLIVFVACLSLAFTSCTKEEDKCWVYTITSVTTASENNVVIPEMTQTSTTSESECGLTETEAKAKAKAMATTVTNSDSGYTITIKVTVDYKEQDSTTKE